jgi:protein SCO1
LTEGVPLNQGRAQSLSLEQTLLTEQDVRVALSHGGDETLVAELLRESHPVYRELGAPAIVRIRGGLLYFLGQHPLKDWALPFVLEELESAHDPYLTALAARALRCSEPREAYADALMTALLYIRFRDDSVALRPFDGYEPGGTRTTAVKEILKSLKWLGPKAKGVRSRLRQMAGANPDSHDLREAAELISKTSSDCCSKPLCCASETGETWEPQLGSTVPVQVELEDHDGHRLLSGDHFVGKPTFVVFFYTRCENVAKCPQTVSKLGRLQELLREHGLHNEVRTAALTYDPDRMRRFAKNWGASPCDNHRFLRSLDAGTLLDEFFGLQVGYSQSRPNRHRLEAFLLDEKGRIVRALLRSQWDEQEMLEFCLDLLKAKIHLEGRSCG